MRPGCPWKRLRPGPKGHVEQESPVPSLPVGSATQCLLPSPMGPAHQASGPDCSVSPSFSSFLPDFHPSGESLCLYSHCPNLAPGMANPCLACLIFKLLLWPSA